jgi:hypothetical protein
MIDGNYDLDGMIRRNYDVQIDHNEYSFIIWTNYIINRSSNDPNFPEELKCILRDALGKENTRLCDVILMYFKYQCVQQENDETKDASSKKDIPITNGTEELNRLFKWLGIDNSWLRKILGGECKVSYDDSRSFDNMIELAKTFFVKNDIHCTIKIVY